MNNDLTIIEEMIRMPLPGETQAGSAEEQPARARDGWLGVTDYRISNRPPSTLSRNGRPELPRA